MRRSHVLAAAAALSLVAVALASAPRPVEAAPTSVHLTAVGDYNATASTTAVLTGIKAANPDLHLALGDLAYASSDEYAWCSYVKSLVGNGFPFELLSGNHESNGLNGSINNFSACLPNQVPGVVGTYGREWYVDVPAQAPLVRLVMISPGLTFPEGTWRYAVGDAHYQWTSNAIDGARSAHIPWVVVGMHAPCISVGQHPCDSGADITNLLLSKKVDLVLAGHEHYYTRTKQLHLGTGCSALVPGTYDPDCVGDADDDVQKDAGTVVITAGTGGTPIREVNTADSEMPYLAAWSGSNVSPSYGFLDVTADADTLEARFVPATGSFTDAVTIRAAGGPGGQPPTAAVAEPQCAALACGFDGSGSSDPDGGSLTAYAWDFGDGATGTGTTPSHTYGAAGTYFVSLTVTDDEGTTGTASRLVTVNDGSPQPLAADGFGRTVAKGWGGADIGGQWSVSANARTSVQAGMGRLLMPKVRAATSARLDEVSSTSSDLRVALTVDKTLVGGGVNATVIGRSTPAGGQYRSTVRLKPGGAVQVSLDRFDAGTLTTVVAPVTLSGVTVTPGTLLHVRMQTTGAGPTTLRVKAWLDGQAEPSSWRSTATDGTAGLQVAGGVGVMATLTPAATNAPVTLLVDDLQVTPVGP